MMDDGAIWADEIYIIQICLEGKKIGRYQYISMLGGYMLC